MHRLFCNLLKYVLSKDKIKNGPISLLCKIVCPNRVSSPVKHRHSQVISNPGLVGSCCSLLCFPGFEIICAVLQSVPQADFTEILEYAKV